MLRSFWKIFSIPVSCGLLASDVAGGSVHQSWDEVDLGGEWKRVDVEISGLVRLNTDPVKTAFLATGITADLKLRRELSLTTGYLLVDLPQSSTHVHAPLVALSTLLSVWGVTLTD